MKAIYLLCLKFGLNSADTENEVLARIRKKRALVKQLLGKCEEFIDENNKLRSILLEKYSNQETKALQKISKGQALFNLLFTNVLCKINGFRKFNEVINKDILPQLDKLKRAKEKALKENEDFDKKINDIRTELVKNNLIEKEALTKKDYDIITFTSIFEKAIETKKIIITKDQKTVKV